MQTSQSSHPGFRLSYQQRRLWLHAHGQAGVVPNVQCGLSLQGDLNASALREAVRQIVNRHQILRTTFHLSAGLTLPVQVVAPQGKPDWRNVDLLQTAPREQPARVEACRLSDLREPFDLAAGPVLRASLLALSPATHLLLLTLPALCADAASLRNLARELHCGEDPGDAIQYIQLSEWQQSLHNEQDAEQGREHWRARRGSPPLVLPLQRAASPTVFIPESCDLPIAPQLAARLRSVEREDVFLLGCWMTLLWRASGQSVVRTGVTCHGRSYEELQAAVGPVARVVPVSCSMQDGLRFGDLLASLAETVDEAGDWQEFYQRSDDEGFYEAAAFELTEWPAAATVDGLRVDLACQQSCPDRFHIKLSITRAGDRLSARLDYDPQVLIAEFVERLAERLCTLLGAALDDRETPIEQLPILGDRERRFVVEECNRTHAAYPGDSCLHQLFAAQAARTPHRIAVTFAGASLTYDVLDRRANQLAHRLRSLGVGPEVRVGIFMYRSLEMMIGLLAVLKAGGAYVPLDPAYPAERLAFMVADSQALIVLTERGLRQSLPATPGTHVLCLDEPFDDFAGRRPASEPRSGVCAQNLVYAMYTSGSTGKPKGVLITHRSLVNYLSWCAAAYAVEAGVGTLVHSSIGFDATITGLFPPLLAGRSVELLPEAEGIDGLPEALKRTQGFSLIKITPAHLSLLNAAAAGGEFAGKARALVIGGEALVSARLSAWRSHAPETRLINEYGPTETVVGCCVHEVGEADMAGETVPIGRPIANTQLYILDPCQSPLPVGIPGELFIGGHGVARGYHGRPALTAERFLPDHLSGVPGARFYRTGDLAVHLNNGVLNFLGRLDRQVKIRSYRIELGEIEAQIEQYPGVTQCVVAACAQGSGEKALVAYIQSPPANAPSSQELRAFLLGKLPEYMVPVVFVVLDALPLNAHGKVDRAALPDPIGDLRRKRGEAEAARVVSGAPYVAPRTPAEEALAAIWRDVLKLERVGIHDDFFRSGGDSIQSILVAARAAKAGLRFTTRELFQNPTIAALASRAGVNGAPAAGQHAVDGAAPLTPIQRWFFERELPQPHHFNQSVLLDVSPELRLDLLHRAVEQLVAHHDALRLRFTREADGWRQTHAAPEGTALVEEVDLAGLPAAEQNATLAARAGQAQSTLNLSQGPLLHALLFRFGGGAPSRLLLVIHHLVVDGVSWRILLEDFAALYQQVELPAKTTAFKAWAARLQQHSGSGALALESDYWLKRSATQTPLPVDFQAEAERNTVASTACVRIWLSRQQSSALLHEVPAKYRTKVDDLLLTALLQACARWTGSRSLSIDLEGHGREELFSDLDVSRTVGWFTSIYPVHLELAGRDPEEELKSVKEQLRSVPQRGIGYGLLRYLSPDASLRARLAALPGAQVSFNYLGRLDGFAAEPILRLAGETPGAEESPLGRRLYPLEVVGQVLDGCLRLDLVYSTALHQHSTIETLAKDILSCVESLLEHCLSPGAGGLTPSDFPEAGLSQEELNLLVTELE